MLALMYTSWHAIDRDPLQVGSLLWVSVVAGAMPRIFDISLGVSEHHGREGVLGKRRRRRCIHGLEID